MPGTEVLDPVVNPRPLSPVPDRPWKLGEKRFERGGGGGSELDETRRVRESILHSKKWRADFSSISDGNKRREHLALRLIHPDEAELIADVAALHTRKWGKEYEISLDTWKQRVKNGCVIAAFERGEKGEEGRLLGTISTMVMKEEKLVEGLRRGLPPLSVEEITGNDTYDTNDPLGDILACTAITVAAAGDAQEIQSENSWLKRVQGGGKIEKADMLAALREKNWGGHLKMAKAVERLGEAVIEDFVKLNLDGVLRFHSRPKGGLSRGARPYTIQEGDDDKYAIVKGGRPKDIDSLGYLVVMAYPRKGESGVDKDEAFMAPDEEVKDAEALIEAAALLTQDLGLQCAFPISRPGTFRRKLITILENPPEADIPLHKETIPDQRITEQARDELGFKTKVHAQAAVILGQINHGED